MTQCCPPCQYSYSLACWPLFLPYKGAMCLGKQRLPLLTSVVSSTHFLSLVFCALLGSVGVGLPYLCNNMRHFKYFTRGTTSCQLLDNVKLGFLGTWSISSLLKNQESNFLWKKHREALQSVFFFFSTVFLLSRNMPFYPIVMH